MRRGESSAIRRPPANTNARSAHLQAKSTSWVEIQEKILGDEKPVTVRYADLLEPGFEKAKAELGERAKSDEDVLSYIAFPAQAEKFFDNREIREKNTFSYSIEQID